MTEAQRSRREFLAASQAMLAGSWAARALPVLLATAEAACKAERDGAPLAVLNSLEATEIDAIAAQIIPTDSSPGAREAGVVRFVDRALATFMAADADRIRAGLADFLTDVRKTHGSATFSKLADTQQIDYLRSIEHTAFFDSVRMMTIAGMFADPAYGGNRDKLGWQLLSFDDRHFWQPPFGYYDERYTDEDDDGDTL